MPLIPLPEKPLRRIAELLASHGEEKASAWLLEAIAAQQCPEQDVRDRVNSLRPEWEAFSTFDAMEENHFRANETDLRALRPEDWEVMRDYLAYAPRDGENFFQVQKRSLFLQCPEDTLGAAARWAKSHRRKPFKLAPKKQESTHHDIELDSLLTEVFKDAVWNQPDERRVG